MRALALVHLRLRLCSEKFLFLKNTKNLCSISWQVKREESAAQKGIKIDEIFVKKTRTNFVRCWLGFSSWRQWRAHQNRAPPWRFQRYLSMLVKTIASQIDRTADAFWVCEAKNQLDIYGFDRYNKLKLIDTGTKICCFVRRKTIVLRQPLLPLFLKCVLLNFLRNYVLYCVKLFDNARVHVI